MLESIAVDNCHGSILSSRQSLSYSLHDKLCLDTFPTPCSSAKLKAYGGILVLATLKVVQDA